MLKHGELLFPPLPPPLLLLLVLLLPPLLPPFALPLLLLALLLPPLFSGEPKLRLVKGLLGGGYKDASVAPEDVRIGENGPWYKMEVSGIEYVNTGEFMNFGLGSFGAWKNAQAGGV